MAAQMFGWLALQRTPAFPAECVQVPEPLHTSVVQGEASGVQAVPDATLVVATQAWLALHVPRVQEFPVLHALEVSQPRQTPRAQMSPTKQSWAVWQPGRSVRISGAQLPPLQYWPDWQFASTVHAEHVAMGQ
jgi:hypothetical protein